MSCQRLVLVPRSVNLTGKRDNAGHEKTTENKLAIIVRGLSCKPNKQLDVLNHLRN